MRKQQRQILLLLDNAPSHAVQTIDLTNISVMFLPANTTSLIQPMDAGIIAAFKKRYRSFQLGMALDREKNSLSDIYKVDIVQAMIWCRDSWKMITATSIKNSWCHTGLLDAVDANSSDDDLEENDSEKCLEKIIEQLTDRALDLNEYLGQDNDFEVHQQFTDEDILATFYQNSDSEDDDVVEISEPQRVLSLDEKINALQISIEVLNENSFENFIEIQKTTASTLWFLERAKRIAACKFKAI
jgi:hypothetical protein